MKMSSMTFKVDSRLAKDIERVSKRTRISKSAIVREGIEMAILKYEEGQISPEFRKRVDQNIRQDTRLLARLKDA